MHEMLLTDLVNSGRYTVLERQVINEMYDGEHQLINSGAAVRPKAGQFKIAHYTIAAAVSEFEFCNGGMGGGLNVGRLTGIGELKVGASVAKAKVVVDIRVIDVETGEVIGSVKGKGKSKRTGFDFDGFIEGVDFGSSAFSNSPLGQAVRGAIENATQKLHKRIPERTDSAEAIAAAAENAKLVGSGSGSAAGLRVEAQSRSDLLACSTLYNNCWEIKILDKTEKGDRYHTLQLETGKKEWVAKRQIVKTYPADSYELKLGDRVYLPYQAKGREQSYDRCTITDFARSQSAVNVSCGSDQSMVALALPIKNRSRKRRRK